MKIYTRGGDKGQTSAIDGRLAKNHSRIEAYGTIDELNSFVGAAISSMDENYGSSSRKSGLLWDEIREVLLTIQHELFDCGSDLAFIKKGDRSYKVNSSMTDQLESWIDHYDEQTPSITKFILPGGSGIASALHVCRTVCRRAERKVVSFFLEQQEQERNEEVLRYLNRLSDLFFVLARAANARLGVSDVEYERSAHVFANKKKQE